MVEKDHHKIPALERLIKWLENEYYAHEPCGRTHELHLWDWEIYELLAELRPIKPDRRWGSVGQIGSSPTIENLDHC